MAQSGLDLHARLERVFRDVFNDETLVLEPSLTAADIPGWDSLEHVNLMFGIEETFGVQFTGDQFSSFATVGDLERYLVETLLRR